MLCSEDTPYREQPGRSKHRENLDDLAAKPVHDRVRADHELAQIRTIGQLRYVATGLRELLKLIWCGEEALRDEASVARRISFDELADRAEVVGGLKGPANLGHPKIRSRASSRLRVWPASACFSPASILARR